MAEAKKNWNFLGFRVNGEEEIVFVGFFENRPVWIFKPDLFFIILNPVGSDFKPKKKKREKLKWTCYGPRPF